MKIADNCVVSIHYTLTDEDGNIIDSSAGSEPMSYIQGLGHIIVGLERALAGKTAGESLKVVVQPEDAYGEIDPDLIQTLPRAAFSGIDTIEVGMEFQAQADDNHIQYVIVKDVTDDEVTVDSNHALAGKVLHFDVRIEAVREADEEEIAHGPFSRPMSLSIRQALALSTRLEADTARLDIELLLGHCLGKPRSYLRAWPERLLTEAEQRQFHELLCRRQGGEPMAYILGEREFWSLPLAVSPATLIPRPETELLVETALALPLPHNTCALDLGTGTGAIALALAQERPQWRLTATDRAPQALALAQANSQRLGLPLELIESDWFSALAGRRYHLILSNPPYIDACDPHLHVGDVRFEPSSALVAGANGLQDLFTIIEQAPSFLTPGGWLLLEHGWQQAQAVVAALSERGFSQVRWQADLAGQPRMSLGQWPENLK